MAGLYGIETPQTRANIRKDLKAVFQYNFRHSLRNHACTQRAGYAMGAEPGQVLCSWPKGGEPTLPFIYSGEVWTGIEYQVASHLIAEGMVAEGLTIVKAARSRHDGLTRNPWNEYECGGYYARALASYALLWALSGFRYSGATKTLWLGSKIQTRKFKAFFSAASGFGTISISKGRVIIEMVEGVLAVENLYLTRGGRTRKICLGITAKAGKKTTIRTAQSVR